MISIDSKSALLYILQDKRDRRRTYSPFSALALQLFTQLIKTLQFGEGLARTAELKI